MTRTRPMLATLIDEPFNDPNWIFEIKWDGYRTLAEINKGKVFLYSRNLQPFNELFAPIARTLSKKFKGEALLDGEVVVLNAKGKSEFQLLQNYQRTGTGQLVYQVFDILRHNGRNITNLPLTERKQLLKTVLPKDRQIKYSDDVKKTGILFFMAAQKQGLEGIIAKKSDSVYKPGKRSRDWLKIKTSLRQEAVIGGFTAPLGGRKYFGSLILGVYNRGKLKYIGHSGGGFDESSLKEIFSKLRHIAIKKSPFDKPPKSKTKSTWVAPKFVCEVAFSEWTSEGQMRHPVFLGLRNDKNPKQVKKELPI